VWDELVVKVLEDSRLQLWDDAIYVYHESNDTKDPKFSIVELAKSATENDSGPEFEERMKRSISAIIKILQDGIERSKKM
jgi:hypothetical protein